MSNRDRARKKPSKPSRKRRASSRKAAAETTFAMIDRLLLSIKVPVRINGEERKITAFEAIIRQLIMTHAAGNKHANSASLALQKFEELAPVGNETLLQIAFVESDYTQTLAATTTTEAGHEGL